MFTNHNNLQRFMNMKNLSSRKVRYVQKLSRYHFRIDYWQDKANGVADALFHYPKWSAEKEETLQAENTKILQRLQFSLARMSGLNVGKQQQVLSPLYQVLICGTVVLPQLYQLWDTLRTELAAECPSIACIEDMRIRLLEL